MVSHHFFSQLVLLTLLWLFILLHLSRPKRPVTAPAVPALPEPLTPKRPRSNEPKPFEGLIHKPHCALCEQDTAYPKAPLAMPPDPMVPTHRRPREVDTSRHFCPHSDCAYRGWLGLADAALFCVFPVATYTWSSCTVLLMKCVRGVARPHKQAEIIATQAECPQASRSAHPPGCGRPCDPTSGNASLVGSSMSAAVP